MCFLFCGCLLHCWKIHAKVGSHNPLFGSNYFYGIVSVHRNVDQILETFYRDSLRAQTFKTLLISLFEDSYLMIFGSKH